MMDRRGCAVGFAVGLILPIAVGVWLNFALAIERERAGSGGECRTADGHRKRERSVPVTGRGASPHGLTGGCEPTCRRPLSQVEWASFVRFLVRRSQTIVAQPRSSGSSTNAPAVARSRCFIGVIPRSPAGGEVCLLLPIFALRANGEVAVGCFLAD